jgi:antitoxin ParD1/3/4
VRSAHETARRVAGAAGLVPTGNTSRRWPTHLDARLNDPTGNIGSQRYLPERLIRHDARFDVDEFGTRPRSEQSDIDQIRSAPDVGNDGKFCQQRFTVDAVTTMNVSLPDELKTFVDERVDSDYGSTSEYIRDLTRRDREREHFRSLILEGANSEPGRIADDDYFTSLRARISTGT